MSFTDNGSKNKQFQCIKIINQNNLKKQSHNYTIKKPLWNKKNQGSMVTMKLSKNKFHKSKSI